MRIWTLPGLTRPLAGRRPNQKMLQKNTILEKHLTPLSPLLTPTPAQNATAAAEIPENNPG